LAEGRKGDLSRTPIHLTKKNRRVTQSVGRCEATDTGQKSCGIGHAMLHGGLPILEHIAIQKVI
ncbi:hypothetical protein, partial [Pseudomonas syringae]|uniref:hypothetical protein n=1 Tax=Pseudomonas syringae TaxID=317 RepID=UPI0019684D3A